MIPLMLDLSASSVLIVGCGAVGQRKAGYFADSCREVFQIDELPKNPEELISRYDIIVAATASESLNETICSIARSQNKWYNSATGIGNFLIPAAFSEENFTLAVSTGGKAPAVSAYLRDYIQKNLPAVSQMISLQETLRTELKTAVPEQARRAEILRAVLDDDSVWKALDSDDFDAALNLARRNI
jgi:precorrin-2 dehydrogenase/sirohydrochlorin ferrochelatase